MEHLAIMKKSWTLTEKILSGKKKIESRWYKQKRAPWNKISAGDKIYFKDSGCPVSIMATADKILQFSDLNPAKIKEIIVKYGNEIALQNPEASFNMNKDKNYCMLIYLKNPQKIQPFHINKKGYGNMSAWISLNSIEEIRR